MAWVRVCIVMALLGAAGASFAQDDERKPASKRAGDDGVPLEKLPLPPGGTVVVTPDLKRALDALGAGSVVLSAEHYRELMNRLNAQGQDKGAGEILFGAFRIEGEVKTAPGRETAELVFELEFRTDAPNATVLLPFKGVRFSSAALNGAPPVWGPDPERLSVLVKEPQACKLRLTAAVPVTRAGNERRVTLEKVPAATVTSLDLAVPGNVTQAIVLGAGLIPVNRGNGSAPSRLQSSALGVLSGLDLAWQLGEAAAGQAGIEGDIRITLEDTAAQVEAKLRPVPLAPLQLPWKVRLPAGVAQLRAELVRTEGLGSEPLVITRNSDGTFTITSPYPTATFDFTQVLLRWKQPFGEGDAKNKVLLGTCEVVEPAGRQQTGVITLVAPDEPTVMLRSVNAVAAERPPFGAEKHTTRYRYAQQPAGLDAIPLPPALTRGAVEYKLTHTLSIQDGAWILTTDLEVTRAVRAQLTTLELAWPAEWQVSRRVLFSPVVKDIEQDTKAQRLRILLDGKPPGTFTIRLESSPAANAPGLTVSLPHLVAAQGLVGQRAVAVELVGQQEKVKLDARTWDLRLDPATTGLREEPGDGPQFAVTAHPAVLAVTREPRLPKYRCRLEAFLAPGVVQTRQTFNLRWQGVAPRRLNLLIPRGVTAAQFLRTVAGSTRLEPLTAAPRREDAPGAWETWVVDVPAGEGAHLQLVCLLDAAAGIPVTVPVARFADGQVLAEGGVEAYCLAANLALKLPPLPGWRLVAETPGAIELYGDSLDQLLALDVQPAGAGGVAPARVRDCHVTVRSETSAITAQYTWTLDALRATDLVLEAATPSGEAKLLEWALDDQSHPPEQVPSTGLENGTAYRFSVPPRRLGQAVTLQVTLQFTGGRSALAVQVPAVRWAWGDGPAVEGPRRWRVEADPAAWLVWSNQRLDETYHPGSGWTPAVGQTAGSTTYLAFRDVTASGGLYLILVPRTAALVVLSVLAFGSVRFLARRPDRLLRALYAVAVAVVLLHLALPPLAAVLLVGLAPGAAVALVTFAAERWLRWRRTRRPVVFQRGVGRDGSAPTLSSPRSLVLAEAPTLVPDTRSPVH